MPSKGNINRLVCFENGQIQRKWPYIFSIDVTGEGYLTNVKQSVRIIEFSIFPQMVINAMPPSSLEKSLFNFSAWHTGFLA